MCLCVRVGGIVHDVEAFRRVCVGDDSVKRLLTRRLHALPLNATQISHETQRMH